MKLYLLKPIKEWVPWYDTAMGFVVAADTQKRARYLASDEAGDEGVAAWFRPDQTTCEEIANDTTCEEGVVIRDFADA